MTKKKDFNYKQQTIVSVLSTLAIVILLTLWGSVQKGSIIELLHGVPLGMLENMKSQSSVIESGFIDRGVIYTTSYPIEYPKERNNRLIKEKQEVIIKILEIKEPAIIDVSAWAKCKIIPRSSGPNDVRLNTIIYIDGIECSANSVISDGIFTTLDSNAIVSIELDPGKHQLRVEGVVLGYANLNHIDAKLFYKITRKNPGNLINNSKNEKKGDMIAEPENEKSLYFLCEPLFTFVAKKEEKEK